MIFMPSYVWPCQTAAVRCAIVVVFLTHGAMAQESSFNPVLVTNPQRIHMGLAAALEGGAMVARASDASATWYNPAGLVRAKASSFSGSVSLYELASVTYSSPGSNSVKRDEINTIPAFVGSVGWLGESPAPEGNTSGRAHDPGIDPQHSRYAWGFAVAAPVSWKSTTDIRRSDVATTGDSSANSGATEIQVLAPTLGLAYAVHERLSFGISTTLVYRKESSSTRQSYDRITIADGTASFYALSLGANSETMHLRFAGSVSYRPNDTWSFGAQIKTPGIKIRGKSSTQYDYLDYNYSEPNQATSSHLSVATGAERKVAPELSTGVALQEGNFECEATLNVRFPIGRYASSDGDLTALGKTTADLNLITQVVFPQQEIRERAVANLAFGAAYKLSDTWAIHGGLFTDRSSIDASDSSNVADIDLYGVNAGLSRQSTFTSLAIGLSFVWSGVTTVGRVTNAAGESVPIQVELRSFSVSYGSSFFF